MPEKSIIVKCNLKDEYVDRFEAIQDIIKSDNNAETIREMIDVSLEYLGFNAKFVEVPIEMYENLSSLANRVEIRRKLNVFSIGELVRWIISEKIKELEEEKKSLIHWDVKKGLNREEKDIANALGKLLMNNQGGVTASQISEVLVLGQNNDRRLKYAQKIEQFLDSKFEEGYIERDEDHNGDKVYYAW